jgi:hypothetical protein
MIQSRIGRNHQRAERLPSMHRALGSIPRTEKKRIKKRVAVV